MWRTCCDKRFVTILLCLTMTLTAFASTAFPMNGNLTRFFLPNGLEVLVKEDHSRKVAAIQMWVMVGSAYEHDEERGISHLVERMAFHGTQRRGMGQMAKEVEQVGGEINAYTSWDETVFHVLVPSSATAKGLDMITDAVFRPLIDPTELHEEKKVVLEEILMAEDRPDDVASRLLFATAYAKNPYAYPMLGSKDSVTKLTREHILAFRQRWYVPTNMFLLVVGDVSPAAVRKELEHLTSDVTPVACVRPTVAQESPERIMRGSVLRNRNAKEARLSLAFHIPCMRGKHVNALDLAADMLGGRDDSRLTRVLRQEKGLVSSFFAYSLTPKHSGLMIFSATLDAKNLQAATRGIMEELTRLARLAPSPEEVQDAKTHVETEHVYARETVQGVARSMGAFRSQVGDAEYAERYLALSAAVTPLQVSEAVRTYLMPPNVTVSVLLPESDAEDFRIEDLERIIQGFRFGQGTSALTSSSRTERMLYKELANGIKVVLAPDESNPVVSIRIACLGGKRFESEDAQGIMNFISRMLTKGAAGMTQADIVRKVTALGGALDGFSGYDSLGLYASFLNRYAEQGLELLAQLYAAPAFPQDELDRERDIIINHIKTETDSPTEYVVKVLNKAVFPHFPYGFDQLGTVRTISGFTRETLEHTYRRFAVPSNTVIAVVGQMDTEEVLHTIERLFGTMSGKSFDAAVPRPAVPIQTPREMVLHMPRVNTYIAMGFQAASLHDPDRFPLEVLDNILAGQGGRLLGQLRDKESLAYVVTSFFRPGMSPGVFGLYLGCDASQGERAFLWLKGQINLVRRTKVTDAELKQAIDNLIGNHFISLQSSASRAQAMGLNTLYGLGHDFDPIYVKKVREVTAEDVLRVAHTYLDLDHCAVVKIVPEEGHKAGTHEAD